jgi:hypothetical protein
MKPGRERSALVVLVLALGITCVLSSSSNKNDNNSNNNNPGPSTDDSHRLQTTVLAVLYLCLASLCCVVPFAYFVRLILESQKAHQQWRDLELAAVQHAENNADLVRYQNEHRDELRLLRIKYMEERRARIVQLLSPVRMVRGMLLLLMVLWWCS